MPPDPKPQPRHRSRSDWNAIVRGLIVRYGECECGCGRPAESGHHFIKRRDGDDVEANCVVLAGSGTTLCHGAVEGNIVVTPEGERITPEAVRAGLRERIETERRDVLEYVLEKKGRDWLDMRYAKEEDRP